MKGLTTGYDLRDLKPYERRNIRQRVDDTLHAANGIDGKGIILAIVWGITPGGFALNSGVVVRELARNVDAVSFYLCVGGVKFLGKVRVILP